MKALTLYQPYGTLVKIKAKNIETRSWGTKYRGPLGIHASKNQPKRCKELERKPGFKEALYPNGNYLYPWAECGCMLCIVVLMDCIQITYPLDEPDREYNPYRILARNEINFGDYSIGRYMWFLEFQRKIDPPIPVKGSMGLWEWDEKPYLQSCATRR